MNTRNRRGLRCHSPPPGSGHARQRFLRTLPARGRVSGGAAAAYLGSALLQAVGLGDRLVGVCGRGHMCLRKELLQAFMLVREDADIVAKGSRHSLPIIQDDDRKHAAMIFI